MLQTVKDEFVRFDGIMYNQFVDIPVKSVFVIRVQENMNIKIDNSSDACDNCFIELKKLKENVEITSKCSNKNKNDCNYYYIGISFCCFFIVLSLIYAMFFMNKTNNNTETYQLTKRK